MKLLIDVMALGNLDLLHQCSSKLTLYEKYSTYLAFLNTKVREYFKVKGYLPSGTNTSSDSVTYLFSKGKSLRVIINKLGNTTPPSAYFSVELEKDGLVEIEALFKSLKIPSSLISLK